MQANEFVKGFGWDKARRIVNSKPVKLGLAREIADWKNIDFDELKCLVEAHELVELYGGLESAKNTVAKQNNLYTNMKLVQAIAYVESCQ